MLAGELVSQKVGGEFTYSSEWLEHPDAYPLDPVNLPLKPGVHRTSHRSKVFLAMSDAAPDAWGTRLMLLKHRSSPKNEIERLLRTSGHGVGALQFSLSRSRPKNPQPPSDYGLLSRLASTAKSIDEQHLPTDEELKLIEPGSSMGGARPKTTVADRGSEYIVKFSRVSDLIDVPRVEYASMRMLAMAGLHVPEVRLDEFSPTASAFLIERFDRKPGKVISHYVSAHALFDVDRHREYASGKNDPAGYIALSRILRSHSAEPKADCEELFRRIVANILIGNTDDHARNHGLIFDLERAEWRLAPCFDILPIVGASGQQAMTVGVDGRASTLENAMSAAPSFGLRDSEAIAAIENIHNALSNWEEIFRGCGVSERDTEIVRSVMHESLRYIEVPKPSGSSPGF